MSKEVLVCPMEGVSIHDCAYPNYVKADDGVAHTWFHPIGYGHQLQQLITKLLHTLVMKYSDKTLSEMGYFHHSSILLVDGRVDIRIYFKQELATVEKPTMNGQTYVEPIPQLGIFNGYLFYLEGDQIDLRDVVGYGEELMPKCKIGFNELGHPALFFKEGGEMKKQNVCYIKCNLPILMAAAMDLDLLDPNFNVMVRTVGYGSNRKRQVVLDGKENQLPIWVGVQHTEEDHKSYDPNNVRTYLVNLQEKISKRHEKQRELMSHAEEKTSKEKKKKNKPKKNFVG